MPQVLPSSAFIGADKLPGGLPRGAITEVTGGRSSGKTGFMCSVLAQATARAECCAVIDTHDVFDPVSAALHGVDLGRLVWVRCRGDAQAALKAADMILHGGGFGVVCLDLSEVPLTTIQRIPLSWWWRFRRAVERTPAILLVLGREAAAKTCSSCWLEFRPANAIWSGRKPFRLLRGLETEIVVRKAAKNAVTGHPVAGAVRSWAARAGAGS